MKILSAEDKFCVALICLADQVCQALEQRTTKKTRRWHKIQKLKEAIQEIDDTFDGSVDEEFMRYAEEFYDEMSNSLTKLLKQERKGTGWKDSTS